MCSPTDTSEYARHVWTTDVPVNFHELQVTPQTRRVRCHHSVLFSILAVHLLLPVIAIAQSPTKRVLVIASYDLNRPAVNVFIPALRSTIAVGSKERVEFFYEFQENTRIPTDKYEAAMVSYMKRKYEGEKLDLAIALGAPAVKILLGNEANLHGYAEDFLFSRRDRRNGA
jgi:hypothetical protein